MSINMLFSLTIQCWNQGSADDIDPIANRLVMSNCVICKFMHAAHRLQIIYSSII